MGAYHSSFNQIMDSDEIRRRVGNERLRNMRKYFNMLAFPENTIDLEKFKKVILKDYAPARVVQAIFESIASDAGIDFDSLSRSLIIFTEGTVEERSKFLQILLALDVPGGFGKNIGYERISKVIAEDEQTAAELTKVIYKNRSSIIKDSSHEKLKNLVAGSDKLAWLLKVNSAPPQKRLTGVYNLLTSKTNLTYREILFMETKYLQLTENSFYTFNLESFQNAMCPPVDQYLSKALFGVLDSNGNGCVDFVELVFGCNECCLGSTNDQAGFILRFLHNKSPSIEQGHLIHACQRIFNKDLGILTDPNVSIESVCEALVKDEGCRLILFYLQQVFHLFFDLRWRTRESERQNIQGWLNTDGNSALREGEYWYAIDRYWMQTWQGTKIKKKNSSLLARKNSFLHQIQRYRSVSKASRNPIIAEYNDLPPIDNTNLVDRSTAAIIDQIKSAHDYQLKPADEIKGDLDYMFLPYPVWAYLRRTYGGGPIIRRRVIYNWKGCLEIEVYKVVIKFFGDLDLIRHVNSFDYRVVLQMKTFSICEVDDSHLIVPEVSSVNSVRQHPKMKKGLIHVMTCSRYDQCEKIIDEVRRVFCLQKNDFRLWLSKTDVDISPTRSDVGSLYQIDSTQQSVKLADIGVSNTCRVYIDVRHDSGQWSMQELHYGSNERNLKHDNSGSGLDNLGNTCYMNSVLQCLSHCNILTNYLLNPATDKRFKSKGTVVHAYRKLLKEMLQKKIAVLSTIEIRNMLNKHSDKFSSEFEQHDTTEFLQCFLNCLHQDLKIVTNDKRASLTNDTSLTDVDKYWRNHVNENNSIITEIFDGLQQFTIACGHCGYNNASFEPFNVLSVPIPQGNKITIRVKVFLCTDIYPCLRSLQFSVNESLTLRSVRSMMEQKLNCGQIVFFDQSSKSFEIVENENIGIKLMNFDKIIAYELEGPVSEKQVITSDVLIVYQRRVTEEPLSFSSIDRYRVDCIGIPFVFRRSSLGSLCELYSKIEGNVKALMKSACERSPIFQLCKVTLDGRLCSTCHWSRFCIGCTFECNDSLVSSQLSNCAVAIEYDLEFLHRYYDFEKATTFHYDAEPPETPTDSTHITLDDCFQEFSQKQKIEGDIVCPSCKVEQSFFQYTSLVKIPQILMIQINRVEKHFGQLEKASQEIAFPVDEGLYCVKQEDSSYILTSDRPAEKSSIRAVYSLYALICHFGSISSGHYLAYTRQCDLKYSDWIVYDDINRKIVSKSEIECLKEYCYMLFYKRLQ